MLSIKLIPLLSVTSFLHCLSHLHADPVGYHTLKGDCPGNHLAKIPDHTASICVTHCEATPGCAGFSHYARRGCYLKNLTCDTPTSSSTPICFRRNARPVPPLPSAQPPPSSPAPGPTPRCPPSCSWQSDKQCCGVWDDRSARCSCPSSIVFSAGNFPPFAQFHSSSHARTCAHPHTHSLTPIPALILARMHSHSSWRRWR